MFRLAQRQDLPRMVEIYNQVIDRRTVTADLEPVTVAQRQSWFDFHDRNAKYPLWAVELNGAVVGWCSYSQFYTRQAYDATTEISFYLDNSVQGRGLGRRTVAFLIEQMPAYGMQTLLGYVFGDNKPSLAVLEKSGFQRYGLLPRVADMQSHSEDLVILGYQLKKLKKITPRFY
ncbi:GNAT family N-acetyltransferase [Pasteurellaceae bacterium LIM206]|nr:GNAT family N-acetyltransferase [Pasteurellaceae bacterium LIM206]